MVEVVQIRIRVPPGSFNQWQRLCADRDDEASPDEPVDSNVSSASSTQCSSSTIHANAPTPSPSDSPTTPRRTTQMSPVNIKASWDDKFNELVAFKTKFGHFNVNLAYFSSRTSYRIVIATSILQTSSEGKLIRNW